MALRGSLKDFGLADVLQLVGLSKKTGVLRVRRGEGEEGSIWLRDGDVFFAQSNWQRTKLGERLIAAQKITPSALDRALQIHASDPQERRIGQILVDESYITAPLLEAFVQGQIQDTIFDLMRWEDGEFAFELLPAVLDEDIGLAVSIENIAIEASRRMEEWERIKSKIPSMDIVFRMAATPGESGFEISLKPTEWNILLLVDGSRSVSDLARATGQIDFEVARIAYGLFSAGLLEVVDEAEAQALRSARLTREAESAGSSETVEPGYPQSEAVAEIVAPAPLPAPAAELAEAEQPQPQPQQPPNVAPPRSDVPEFLLAGQAVTLADDDAAVLEEVMEALFEAPAPEGISPALEAEVPEVEAMPAAERPSPLAPPYAGRAGEVVTEEYIYDRDADATVPYSVRIAIEPSAATPREPVVEIGWDAGTREARDVFEEPAAEEAPVEPAAEEASVEPAAEEAPVGPAAEEATEEPVFQPAPESVEPPHAHLVAESPQQVAEPMSSVSKQAGPDRPRAGIDVGLGGTISDEITALTGAGRTARATAVPERSLEAAGTALQRDTRVNRETVLKIIDAIKNL